MKRSPLRPLKEVRLEMLDAVEDADLNKAAEIFDRSMTERGVSPQSVGRVFQQYHQDGVFEDVEKLDAVIDDMLQLALQDTPTLPKAPNKDKLMNDLVELSKDTHVVAYLDGVSPDQARRNFRERWLGNEYVGDYKEFSPSTQDEVDFLARRRIWQQMNDNSPDMFGSSQAFTEGLSFGLDLVEIMEMSPTGELNFGEEAFVTTPENQAPLARDLQDEFSFLTPEK